ncbi:hypothetical protein [Halobacillus amylolyticus]|uniref:Uncharacterized protein n=1 Tax=Halobacillus amylolyticus TaxID=2932259 RepID=A0ABY4H7I8_9BACI|nr:hypothetical protein [Halobacillus amylolyticus]UOR10824.1 hypothetical protein MUO15_14480 [Halobacillus amylolyticus]
MYYDTLQTNVQWLVGVPLLFLVLFILSLMGIARGVKNMMNLNHGMVQTGGKEDEENKTFSTTLKPSAFKRLTDSRNN